MSSKIIYSWLKVGGSYQAKPRENITLVVTPESYGRAGEAKRGTRWHAHSGNIALYDADAGQYLIGTMDQLMEGR